MKRIDSCSCEASICIWHIDRFTCPQLIRGKSRLVSIYSPILIYENPTCKWEVIEIIYGNYLKTRFTRLLLGSVYWSCLVSTGKLIVLQKSTGCLIINNCVRKSVVGMYIPILKKAHFQALREI